MVLRTHVYALDNTMMEFDWYEHLSEISPSPSPRGQKDKSENITFYIFHKYAFQSKAYHPCNT